MNIVYNVHILGYPCVVEGVWNHVFCDRAHGVVFSNY